MFLKKAIWATASSIAIGSLFLPFSTQATQGNSCVMTPSDFAETLWTGSARTTLGESFMPTTNEIRSVSLLIKPYYYMAGEPYNGTLKLTLSKGDTTLGEVTRTIDRSYAEPGDFVFTFPSAIPVALSDNLLLTLRLVGPATGTVYWYTTTTDCNSTGSAFMDNEEATAIDFGFKTFDTVISDDIPDPLPIAPPPSQDPVVDNPEAPTPPPTEDIPPISPTEQPTPNTPSSSNATSSNTAVGNASSTSEEQPVADTNTDATLGETLVSESATMPETNNAKPKNPISAPQITDNNIFAMTPFVWLLLGIAVAFSGGLGFLFYRGRKQSSANESWLETLKKIFIRKQQ